MALWLGYSSWYEQAACPVVSLAWCYGYRVQFNIFLPWTHSLNENATVGIHWPAYLVLSGSESLLSFFVCSPTRSLHGYLPSFVLPRDCPYFNHLRTSSRHQSGRKKGAMLMPSGVNSGELRMLGKPDSGPDAAASSLVHTSAALSPSVKGICLIRLAYLSNILRYEHQSYDMAHKRELCGQKNLKYYKSHSRRFTSSLTLLNKFYREGPRSVLFHPLLSSFISRGKFLHLIFIKE